MDYSQYDDIETWVIAMDVDETIGEIELYHSLIASPLTDPERREKAKKGIVQREDFVTMLINILAYRESLL